MSVPELYFQFQDASGVVRPRWFRDPEAVIVARTVDEVPAALRRVEAAAAEGLWAAGYLAYEAAPAFDPALRVREGAAVPLLWFGLFRQPLPGPPPEALRDFQVGPWEPSVDREAYDRAIASIREAIAAGETYQVNHTLRLRAPFTGSDREFFARLARVQQGGYAAYLNLGRWRILSASPELFFHRAGDRIWTRPMKGTRPRGRYPAEDAARREDLARSSKDRAENLMIVDLMRNDLGRIARPGSVRVPCLFEVEQYPTLFQMTSTVAAELQPGAGLETIFRALFPCGSITGAPKVNTMRWIARLEESPRGVYCGAIGFVSPDEAVFNVAIRTVVVDAERGTAEYGVGGGITWDSVSAAEYAESVAKAAVLTRDWPAFELLETLRLEDGRYRLLGRHLERLDASARYFAFELPVERATAALEAFAAEHARGAWRVRLLVDAAGGVRVEGAPLAPEPEVSPRVALAQAPVSRHDPFLFHKTTHRRVYAERKAERPDLFDVLLRNEEGELTEFTLGNLVVELDGRRWTPPVDCGLLAGTFRAELLARGEIGERVLLPADLGRAERVWLINSVRGWLPVTLAPV